NIESDAFLRYDQLIVDLNLIRKVSTKINLVLLSLRSSQEQGIKQLIKLGLKDCFNEILFVKHEIYNPKIEVLNNLKLQVQEITFVGDSINDYEAARESGVDFIGVGTGLFILPENLNILDNINVYLEKLI
ncbi:HAD family hydrolase, partial [Elizabethkingia miricola]